VVDAGACRAEPRLQAVTFGAQALNLLVQESVRPLQFLVAQQKTFDPFCKLLKL
jgi:hypothetical protein